MVNKKIFKTITSIAMSMAMVASLIPGDGFVKTYAADSFDELGRYVSDLPIEKVEGLPEDFFMGADVSSAQALIDAGVRYVNIDGKEQDLYELMADAGINYVRLRLWNDPYLSGNHEKTVVNSYGAGVCDINYVKNMALAAKKAGLKVLLDFHYSDFWADPGKQTRPKAWKNLSNDEVIQKIYEFTYDSLDTLKKAGADNITMVQVGNETTSRICGFALHTSYAYQAFANGCKAIRDFNNVNSTNIKSVIHYTNESNFNYKNEAKGLVDNNVDFDIFASSFYPEYSSHGTIDSISANLAGAHEVVNTKTGKNIDVMIAEVGYRYIGQSADANGVYAKYGQNQEGMSIFLRDLIAKINEIGGIGVFYWEPAWVDVGLDYNKTGTGWASDNASEYDNGAANGGGKCATSDLALFKAGSTPLTIKAMEALNVFKYVYEGTTSAEQVKTIKPIEIELPIGSEVVLPESINITLRSLAKVEKQVTWDNEQVASVNTNEEGEYFVEGTIADLDTKVYASVEVVDRSIVKANNVNLDVAFGGDINLPATVKGFINGGKETVITVNWNNDELNAINTSVEGDYVVTGKDASNKYPGTIYAYIKVAPGTVSSELVKNGSFENPNDQKNRVINNWTTTSTVGTDETKPIYAENKNFEAVDGGKRLSIWSDAFNDYNVEAYQEINISSYGSGTYLVSCYEQGNVDDIILYVKDGDSTTSITKSVNLEKVNSFAKTEMYVYINNTSKLTVGVKASSVKKSEWANVDLVSVKYCGKGQNLSGKDLLTYQANTLKKDLEAGKVTQVDNNLSDAIDAALALSNDASSTDVENALTNLNSAASESTFNISTVSSVYGEVETNVSQAKPGTKVNVTATSNDNRYVVNAINVYDNNNKLISVNNNSFTMPQSSVRVEVEYLISEENYLSSVFRVYHDGPEKILVLFNKEIPEFTSKYYRMISGKYAYYMDEDKAYGENWYRIKVKACYGKFSVYKADIENSKFDTIYTCDNNTSDFKNIVNGSSSLCYDGYLFADVDSLMKDVNKYTFTFYVYGPGRKELSLMFGNNVRTNNTRFTISGWTGKSFYVMNSAESEYGEGWFKMEISDIDGGFQLYDSSIGRNEDGTKWITNLGLDGGTELYEQILNGKCFYVISDGTLYTSAVETGKYIIGTLDKPVITCSESAKECTYNISWTKVENATEYEIQVGGNTVANVNANTTSYEMKATYGGSNRINVIAKAKGYNNGKSASVTVSVPDEVVSASVKRTSANAATLSWVFTSGGEADGFVIYAKKGNGTFTKIATKPVSTTLMNVTVDAVNTFTYKVVPYCENGFGFIYGKSKSYTLKPGSATSVTTGPKVSSVITDKTYKYKVTKVAKSDGTIGEVSLIGANKKTIKSVKIADVVKIGGYSYKVTSIGNNAFKKYKKLTSVSIGANVKTIGSKAFNGCKKLKSIKINSNVITKMGKASFKGIKKKAKFKVPKAKKKAYKKMIKKSGAKKPIIK